MKKLFLLFYFCLFLFHFVSATDYKVLFVGNSYTEANNLPLMIKQVAQSVGDNITYSSNTPGGALLSMHCTNQSMTLIQNGGWDFVVLQEQSQYPAFPISQVQVEVFPYAAQLNDAIEQYNPCAETIFFMTWGRLNGDPQWQPISTYQGMDDSLYVRYMMMAEDNDAIVSPVGRVWRWLRNTNPSIDLHSSDGSHPSYAGSYAAACTFYTVIFRKDPTLIQFDGSLDAATAQIIRNAVKTVVFDNFSSWFVGQYDPYSDFTFQNSPNLNESTHTYPIVFTNMSKNSTYYQWDFGDGNVSNELNPQHSYSSDGIYVVSLISSDSCQKSDTLVQTIEVTASIPEHLSDEIQIGPNPLISDLSIKFTSLPVGNIMCKIYSSDGKLLMDRILNNELSFIPVSNLPSGLIIVSLYIDNKLYYIQKLIKR